MSHLVKAQRKGFAKCCSFMLLVVQLTAIAKKAYLAADIMVTTIIVWVASFEVSCSNCSVEIAINQSIVNINLRSTVASSIIAIHKLFVHLVFAVNDLND